MLLTIHDANLQKVAFIDNEKQSTLNYYDDTWTRNLETGSSTFEFTVFKKAIKSDTASHKTYNYLNEKAFVSFKYNGKSYVFSVMTVEENEQTITCYCENLNLELINEYANPYKATKAMSFVEYCNAMDLLNFTHLTVGINEISDQKRTLEWEGQDTKLARLLSLAKKFDAEIDFDTELNADSSIKAFKVNVYHENDDNHQGVGRVRNDIQLTYGKNLKSIKRKIDKTGIYTMIRPTGKGKTKNAKGEEVETVVTIGSLGAWSENNADGVREFYQSGEALYAPLAVQMYPSTFTSGTQKDQWIRKDLVVESDNPTVIRAAGIRDLKKNAYPALTYEVDGFLDVEIGDTIKIYDDGFTPILLIRARVSDQKISFTNPNSNKTTFANFKALENNLSDGIQAAFERLFEASKPYLIKLSTDNGVIFKNQIGQSIVTPTLYKGGKPVVANVTWRWALDGDTTTGMTYTVLGSNVTDTATLTVAAYIGNDEVAVDEISFVNVLDGTMGTPGTPGRDGRTPYVHTAWANNATGTSGFSLDSSVNKLYIGIYTDFEPNDSTDPTKYKWTLIKGEKGDKGEQGERGLQGLQGAKGDQGVAGAKGADGRTQYTHIAYSDSSDGRTNFSVSASNRKYIGMYVDFNTADSTNPADYAWTLVKGADGANGTPGKAGADGRTPYFHTAYANSSDGQQDFSVTESQGKKYLGTYTDYTQADSTNYQAYTWSLIKGDDGTGLANVTNFYLASNQSTGIEKPAESVNLIRNGAFPNVITPWTNVRIATHSFYYNGQKKLFLLETSQSSEITSGSNRFDVKRNTEYSLSFYAFSASRVSSSDVWFLGRKNGETADWTTTNKLINSRRFSPVKAEYVTVTFNSGENDTAYIRFDNNGSSDGQMAAMFFGEVMLVEGRESQPWVAAIEDSGWTTIPQQLSYTKRFLWNYRIELYTDGTTKTTDPTVIGVHGEKGDQGERGLQGLQGEKGDKGIQGEKGADGKSSYTHIAYATNSTGTQGFSISDSTNKTYIGMYVDFNAIDSTNPSAYKWTKWKGSDGAQGVPGAKGADGRTPYLHIAYANSADGRTDFSNTNSTNKRYLGTYTDFTPNDSTDPTMYKWVDMVGTVDIGGSNLIRNGAFPNVITPWTNVRIATHSFYYNGQKKLFLLETSQSSEITSGSNRFDVKRNTEYSLSFYAFSASRVSSSDVWFLGRKNGETADWTTTNKLINSRRFSPVKAEYVTVTFNSGENDTAYIRFDNNGSSDGQMAAMFFGEVMLVEGRNPRKWSGSYDEISKTLDGKADYTLTQEQLNALNEKNQLLEAEMKAKASMEALSDLEKAYNAFVKANGEAAKKSEADLIEAGRRIELLSTEFGGLKELKTFIDTYMTSSNEGLIIGKNDASSTIKVSHDRISMFSAGREVMYISQGVIHIDNGIFTASVQVGRFRTEQYHLNADMNVIRYVG
ncbi:phage tail spike protein [Streptococcus suis]|uniref:phage tail spike protein n=1 Tax=Streptococcus suis TaxID=1307 RepID=UPI000AA30796|nr:phage tail spike protein [Streptococcus suis]